MTQKWDEKGRKKGKTIILLLYETKSMNKNYFLIFFAFALELELRRVVADGNQNDPTIFMSFLIYLNNVQK